jgi:hypothetical protein
MTEGYCMRAVRYCEINRVRIVLTAVVRIFFPPILDPNICLFR